jgi:hypothetical protein
MARTVRWLAAAFAILFMVATGLQLVLRFDLLGRPPAVPETADLPTRVLAFQPFDQSRWPVDLTSTLLFAAGFLVLLVLGTVLGRAIAGLHGSVLLGLLSGGAILGAAAQLVYIGGHDVANTVGYCDCGFKNEEAISQTWALMVTDGVSFWIQNGAVVVLAIGAVVAGRALGRRAMPAAWATYSWVVAASVLITLVVATVVPQVDPSGLLLPLVSGLIIPIWALWLAVSFKAGGDTIAA